MKRIRIEPRLVALATAAAVVHNPALDPSIPFEERMAMQRRIWRQQDQSRHIAPWRKDGNTDKAGDRYWLVFAWSTRRRRWVHVAERRIRSHRRKPMTMNRLFAGIRQQLGLKRDVVVKLLTANDHALAVADDPRWDTRPPQHYDGRIC